MNSFFSPLPHLSRSVLTNYQNVIKKEKKREECQEIEPVEISQTFEDISYFPPLPSLSLPVFLAVFCLSPEPILTTEVQYSDSFGLVLCSELV